MDTTPRDQTPIEIERVEFESDGQLLVGNLYRATDANAPAVVVTGTWTSVKEQMANRYAARLAERGLTALSFDHTGYGESGGEPRDVESPALKVQDINAAVGFLERHLNTDRIGALGVCASAGYTAMNALQDSRVRALALIAPWLHDHDIVRDIYGGEEGVQQRNRDAERAQAEFEQTGIVEYVPAVSGSDSRAAMPFPIDFYENPARGGIPQWPNRFAVKAWSEWLTFDPIAKAPELAVPALVVHSEDAAIPQGAHRFIDTYGGEIHAVWTTGTQFDFYDQDPTVDAAAGHAVAHFTRYL